MIITVPLPYPDVAEARIYAELHGLDGGAETVVRLALRQMLDSDPRCEEVALAEQKAKKEARAAVLARYNRTVDGESGACSQSDPSSPTAAYAL